MSEYQRIEYLIGKDGKIVEKVIGGSGKDCVSSTSGIEASLGEVVHRELQPEYYEVTETVWQEETQQNSQY